MFSGNVMAQQASLGTKWHHTCSICVKKNGNIEMCTIMGYEVLYIYGFNLIKGRR